MSQSLRKEEGSDQEFSRSEEQAYSVKLGSSQVDRETLLGSGKWNKLEETLYAAFLIENKKQLKERSSQLFERMAQAIKTRNRAQCYIHHYKMMKRYKSVRRIKAIFYHEKLVGNEIEQYTHKDSLFNSDKIQKQKTVIPEFNVSIPGYIDPSFLMAAQSHFPTQMMFAPPPFPYSTNYLFRPPASPPFQPYCYGFPFPFQ